MCTTCGCGGQDATIEGRAVVFRRADPHAVAIGAVHAHAHVHPHGHVHLDGAARETALGRDQAGASARAAAGLHADSGAAGRTLQVERDLLAKNDAIAALNRHALAERGVFALNLVSSPGSGKTTLLVRTIGAWGARSPVAVVEGDQQTSFDADRIRATGAPAVQVNTGKGCHLDAAMVSRAIAQLGVAPRSLLFIENVGNLVCPAAFDLGEAHKVVILSVTEGENKPLKYPDMFRAADLMLLNKIDLAPYVSFDRARAVEMARRVRPGLEVIELSATTGEGMDRWLAWLDAGLRRSAAPAATASAAPQAA